MTARAWLVAAAVAASAAPAAAQEALAWKLDGPTYLEVTQQVDTTIKVLGQTQEKALSTRFVFRLAPATNADDAAGPVLNGVVQSVRFKDSDDKVDDPILNLKGGRFKVALGVGHRKVAVTGAAGLVDSTFGDAARNATADERRFMKTILDVLLQTQVEEAHLPVTAAPAEPGATWKHTTRMEVASLAAVKLDKTYKVLGRVVMDGKPLVAIGLTARPTVAAPESETPALPFRVTAVKEVGRSRYEGTVYWDPAAGRPHRVDVTTRMSFDMTVTTNGQEFTGAATEVRSMTFRFHATNPDTPAARVD
ncbi:MAG TPA: hypothetical protein VD866_25270 [Urbifossiella sp.]|nr:hypothetical protein [Urbifossiella sp.]